MILLFVIGMKFQIKKLIILHLIGKINKKIQHSFIHQQFDSGFIPSTMIELNNGVKNIKIEDL